jgi:hypothetical protein
MAKINPKAIDAIFDESVLDALPDNKQLGYGIGAAKRALDPTWKENQAKGQIKRSQNSTWLDKKRKAQDRLENDPEYIAKRQVGIDKRTNETEWRKNQLEGIKRNASENKEWAKNKAAGTRKSLAKPCVTPFGVFFTGADAGRKYNELYGIKTGINRICNFLKTGKEGYRYISKEEYIMLTGKEQ